MDRFENFAAEGKFNNRISIGLQPPPPPVVTRQRIAYKLRDGKDFGGPITNSGINILSS